MKAPCTCKVSSTVSSRAFLRLITLLSIGCSPFIDYAFFPTELVVAIQSGTVQLSVGQQTAGGFGLDSAVHVPGFVDGQFTRVFAAQYSVVLIHY